MKKIITPALLSLALAIFIFGINAFNDEKAAKEDAQASLTAVNIELESEKQQLDVTMKQYKTLKEELASTKNELTETKEKLTKTQKDLSTTTAIAAKKKQYLKDKVASLTEQLEREKSLKK